MPFVSLSPNILVFGALLLIHVVDGMQITGLRYRRRDGGHGGDDNPNSFSSTQSHISSTSFIHTSSTSTSLLHNTSSLLSSLPISSLPISSLPTSTSNSQERLAETRHIGTIVGAALGSVIVAGLGLMALANYRRRARKARKRPRASTYIGQFPQTEMSQTQNGPPLTSSAPLIYRPVPMQFANADSSSLSPLMPAATFRNSQDTTRSSRRQFPTSESDGGSDALREPLPSPYDRQPLLSLAVPPLEGPVLARRTSSSASGQLSALHHGMAEFQKALETDHKQDISDQNQSSDPPPKYIG